MSNILGNIFSRGPFSAVQPYLSTPQGEARVPEPEISGPSDEFERSDAAEEAEESSAPPSESLRKGASRTGAQVALQAFPQVVHLLVDPDESWGEDLSKEVGLPVLSLEDGSVDDLHEKLSQPQYAKGFILEGFPADTESAQKLDAMLENVSQEDHRVLSWNLSHEKHQEVLDHYIDRDLLWMVPESDGAESAGGSKDCVLSCLQGLPALN